MPPYPVQREREREGMMGSTVLPSSTTYLSIAYPTRPHRHSARCKHDCTPHHPNHQTRNLFGSCVECASRRQKIYPGCVRHAPSIPRCLRKQQTKKTRALGTRKRSVQLKTQKERKGSGRLATNSARKSRHQTLQQQKTLRGTSPYKLKELLDCCKGRITSGASLQTGKKKGHDPLRRYTEARPAVFFCGLEGVARASTFLPLRLQARTRDRQRPQVRSKHLATHAYARPSPRAPAPPADIQKDKMLKAPLMASFIAAVAILALFGAAGVRATHELVPLDSVGDDDGDSTAPPSPTTGATTAPTTVAATTAAADDDEDNSSPPISTTTAAETSSQTASIYGVATTSEFIPWRPPVDTYNNPTTGDTAPQNGDISSGNGDASSSSSGSTSLIVIIVGSAFVVLILIATLFFVARARRARQSSSKTLDAESQGSGLEQLLASDDGTSADLSSAKSSQLLQLQQQSQQASGLITAYGKYQQVPRHVARRSHQFHFVTEGGNAIVSDAIDGADRKAYELDNFSCATSLTSGGLLAPGPRNKKNWPFPWSPTEFSDAGTADEHAAAPNDRQHTRTDATRPARYADGKSHRWHNAGEPDDYESEDALPEAVTLHYDPRDPLYDRCDSTMGSRAVSEGEYEQEPPSESESEDENTPYEAGPDSAPELDTAVVDMPSDEAPQSRANSKAAKRLSREVERISMRLARGSQRRRRPQSIASHPRSRPTSSVLAQESSREIDDALGEEEQAPEQDNLPTEANTDGAKADVRSGMSSPQRNSASIASSYAVHDIYENFAGNFQLPTPLNPTNE